MKAICTLITALMLCALLTTACAVDNGANPLTADELTQWAEGYLDLARRDQPLNDPTSQDAQTEAGFAFVYPYATLYMSQPDLTAGVLRGVEVVASGERGPHATGIAMTSAEVISRFYHENDSLIGSHDEAVLYLDTGASRTDGALFGVVTRDGQRLRTIQYSVMTPVDDEATAFTDMGIVFTLTDDVVTAITAYGLNSTVDLIGVLETAKLISYAAAEDSYRAVKVSYTGLDLTPFEAADLHLAGFTFPNLSPEEAIARFGAYQDAWVEAEEGYTREMTFGGLTIAWHYNQKMANPTLSGLTLRDDSLEGPRAVRVGDSLSGVMCRFRFGEGSYDGSTEPLYGYPGEAPYGIAEYSEDGSAVLRYVCELDGGDQAVLLLSFTAGRLDTWSLTVQEADSAA